MGWPQPTQPNAFADTILTNAHVWTVDDAKPEAEAIAIGGTKILFVGSSKVTLGLFIGPRFTRYLLDFFGGLSGIEPLTSLRKS
jgi:hypothetical protein